MCYSGQLHLIPVILKMICLRKKLRNSNISGNLNMTYNYFFYCIVVVIFLTIDLFCNISLHSRSFSAFVASLLLLMRKFIMCSIVDLKGQICGANWIFGIRLKPC